MVTRRGVLKILGAVAFSVCTGSVPCIENTQIKGLITEGNLYIPAIWAQASRRVLEENMIIAEILHQRD